uniref:Amino acid transporter transmembrane domain-containing protein n=1 Tax=Pinguiococcus pyrenoidosus TaxID=172671 RepID=A0A6U0W872_9STRA|mmetsp:Transcript_8771/g.33082  ORF Transcript_8771/g.33082 Transcript_8771/m.33082 type:complete len:505 (+) Transcript_8771:133-1647(+)
MPSAGLSRPEALGGSTSLAQPLMLDRGVHERPSPDKMAAQATDSKGSSGIMSLVITFLCYSAGATVIVPYVIVEAGWFGVALLIGIHAAAIWTVYLLSRAFALRPEATTIVGLVDEVFRGRPMIERVLKLYCAGAVGFELMVWLVMFIKQIEICTERLSDGSLSLFKSANRTFVVIMLLMVPTLLVRSNRMLGRFSTASIACVVGALLVLVCQVATDADQDYVGLSMGASFWGSRTGLAVGIVLVTACYHTMVPLVASRMEPGERHRLPALMVWSGIALLALFLCSAVTFFCIFGSETRPQIIMNLQEPFLTGGTLLYTISLFAKFSTVLAPLVELLQAVFQDLGRIAKIPAEAFLCRLKCNRRAQFRDDESQPQEVTPLLARDLEAPAVHYDTVASVANNGDAHIGPPLAPFPKWDLLSRGGLSVTVFLIAKAAPDFVHMLAVAGGLVAANIVVLIPMVLAGPLLWRDLSAMAKVLSILSSLSVLGLCVYSFVATLRVGGEEA